MNVKLCRDHILYIHIYTYGGSSHAIPHHHHAPFPIHLIPVLDACKWWSDAPSWSTCVQKRNLPTHPPTHPNLPTHHVWQFPTPLTSCSILVPASGFCVYEQITRHSCAVHGTASMVDVKNLRKMQLRTIEAHDIYSAMQVESLQVWTLITME